MAYKPISGALPQFSRNAAGGSASGHYLKFYISGTDTPLSMGIDSAPSLTLARCALNSRGEPISNSADGDTWFIPHLDEPYRIVLYANAADADNDVLASAVWDVDGLNLSFDDISPYADYDAVRDLDSSQLNDGDQISIQGFPDPWQVKTGTVTDTDWRIVFNDDPNRYAEGLPNNLTLTLAQFGLEEGLSGNATTNATKIISAIQALRGDSNANVFQHLGDITPITAYASGTLIVPRGVWRIDFDAIELINDFGLTLKGFGSRRFNNALQGGSTLLFPGTSAGFGIKTNGAGARSLTLEDLSVCYEDNTFTGDLIDSLDAPGLDINRCFIGTFGKTGATRYQTANSLLRLTYDEFHSIRNSTFDGAVNGIWSDDMRTINASTFGGFSLQIENTAFYDFTGDMIKIPGNRTRETLSLKGVALNPISVDCARCLHVANVNGLSIDACELTPSTVNRPTIEWATLDNVTGSIKNSVFNALAKAGTISGPNTNLEISGNVLSAIDGFTVNSGSVKAHSNEWQDGTSAWDINPTDTTYVDIGMEQYKAAVTNSINITDNVNLNGHVAYASGKDESTNKFVNPSPRVTILNRDAKSFTESSATYTSLAINTGRLHKLSNSGTQTVTLPAAATNVGITMRFTDIVGKTVNIDRAGSDNIYVGGEAASRARCTSATLGAYIELTSISASEWVVSNASAGWTYT